MPIPLALVAPALQAVGGIAQSIFGGIGAGKARRKLEELKTPTYTPNRGIADLYTTALNRFNTNPADSAQYQLAEQQANRVASGNISNLQDRRAALAGISGIAASQNDALLRAGSMATNEQNRRMGELVNATQIKAGDDRTAFQYNQIAPYEKQYNLLARKAASNSATQNQGFQNIFGGISNAAMMMGGEDGGVGGNDGWSQRGSFYSPFAPSKRTKPYSFI